MRDYSKISPQFWIDEKGKQIKQLGSTTQLIALYLLSSPHSTMLGIYYLPIPLIAHELAIPMEEASKGLAKLSHIQFCTYDTVSEYVWVQEMALSQVGHLKYQDNRVKQINEIYAALPPLPFLNDFHARYHTYLHLKSRDPSPCQALSKSLRSQEQEQEQEQKQEEDQEQDDDVGKPSLNDSLPSSNSKPKNPLLIIKKVEINSSTNEEIITVPLQSGSVFIVTTADIDSWKKTYPDIDVLQELRQLRAWNEANPSERKTRSQVLRHINAWLAKEQRESLQRQQSPPCDHNHNTQLATRGLSPTLAHNLIVGEQWLNSKKTEEKEILC
jgi:hypothetical protein